MTHKATTPINVLLFEFVCGGGCFQFPEFGVPAGSLLREGAEMLQAVADELNQIQDLCVVCPVDERVQPMLNLGRCESQVIYDKSSLNTMLQQAGNNCDYVIWIAPEIEDALQFYSNFFDDPVKLLSPGPEVVRICSDKWLTFQFLQNHNIPTPLSCPGDSFVWSSGPMIGKPRWGAGSYGVRQLHSESEFLQQVSSLGLNPVDFIIQDDVPGLAASVALFQSRNETIFFPAVEQVLDGTNFEYVGCGNPLRSKLQHRSRDLLNRVVNNLPQFTGYLGIDIVLGNDQRDDVVIEINPRFTTSFCTTRKLVEKNCFEFLSNLASVSTEHENGKSHRSGSHSSTYPSAE